MAEQTGQQPFTRWRPHFLQNRVLLRSRCSKVDVCAVGKSPKAALRFGSTKASSFLFLGAVFSFALLCALNVPFNLPLPFCAECSEFEAEKLFFLSPLKSVFIRTFEKDTLIRDSFVILSEDTSGFPQNIQKSARSGLGFPQSLQTIKSPLTLYFFRRWYRLLHLTQ